MNSASVEPPKDSGDPGTIFGAGTGVGKVVGVVVGSVVGSDVGAGVEKSELSLKGVDVGTLVGVGTGTGGGNGVGVGMGIKVMDDGGGAALFTSLRNGVKLTFPRLVLFLLS